MTREYPWRDGDTSSGIERRSKLTGDVEIIPLADAVERVARITKQDVRAVRELLEAYCEIVTAGYQYLRHEPGDPPDRADRRDY